MASIYHVPNMPSTLKNNYPNPSRTFISPSTNYSFLMKHNPENDFTNIKVPSIFKNRSPFIGNSLLAKAQKHSDSMTSVEAKKEITLDRKDMGMYLGERAKLYTDMMRVVHMGSWFFTVPTWWAIALAADPGTFADAKMLALFGVVGVLTHGIACTINDYFDRDIDAKVERTKLRPLVTGEVAPLEALCCLGFQVLLGYGLLLPVNDLSRVLWISSMLFNFSYPLMKRVTYWAQAYLGVAMNFSVLYGWSAVRGGLDGHILLPLYIAGICFTIVYDTIYAHQDKADDEKIGLKSTAILFGELTKEWTTGFTAACIGGLTLTGYLADIGWPYYAFLAAASAQFAWQIWTVDLSSPADCGKTFQTSAIFGALVFSGILFGRLYQ